MHTLVYMGHGMLSAVLTQRFAPLLLHRFSNLKVNMAITVLDAFSFAYLELVVTKIWLTSAMNVDTVLSEPA